MGKRTKKAPQKRRKPASDNKPRVLTKKGTLKHKKGDSKLITSRNVSFEVKQAKKGKWIRTGDRKCNIHTVCDCVMKTDPAKMRRTTNR